MRQNVTDQQNQRMGVISDNLLIQLAELRKYRLDLMLGRERILCVCLCVCDIGLDRYIDTRIYTTDIGHLALKSCYKLSFFFLLVSRLES